MQVRINPSVLAADFVNMEAALQTISTADAVHVDVMDYHFVPNLTFGPQMVGRIHEVSPIPLDVHLMIEHPERWVADFAATGAECVTFHVEATDDPVAVIEALEQAGTHTGISVKPGTPIEPYLDLVERVDQVLIMTVEPGFGGQSFMEEVLGKVTAVSTRAAESGRDVWIQVDGGVGPDTIQAAARAGANTFVAGSSVFDREISPAEAIAELRAKAQAA
ncbi:ribulose-phosphate 3-epimerase [Pontimonas sp.]|uniref:ribulose-phosphate 3-epimerase n=1 Tax=Pontimonas sp. TaxID=2304492 RepID=UPI002870A84F|nr:ribulose-phosphate 3-epimerase [Pontimonas sp.]MDR9396474.1 ribulose-phosphate 3-epimerase [Pontimonas sp.]MDR9433992.1 ribulose-phosphate 3-epimerase [Pontimonas sp.]